jgi:hypothetical protein
MASASCSPFQQLAMTWDRDLAAHDLDDDDQVFRLTPGDHPMSRISARAELQHVAGRTVLLRERTERRDGALDEVQQQTFEITPRCWDEVESLVAEAGIWNRAELQSNDDLIPRMSPHNPPYRFEARRGREYRDFELFEDARSTVAFDRLLDFMAWQPTPTCP